MLYELWHRVYFGKRKQYFYNRYLSIKRIDILQICITSNFAIKNTADCLFAHISLLWRTIYFNLFQNHFARYRSCNQISKSSKAVSPRHDMLSKLTLTCALLALAKSASLNVSAGHVPGLPGTGTEQEHEHQGCCVIVFSKK